MTASCFSTPLTGALTGPRAGRVRPVLAAHPSRAARGLASAQSLRGLALVGLFLVLAALLAPEQPRAQAEICERHNGAAACRVW